MVAELTQVRSCSPASSCRSIPPSAVRARQASVMAEFDGFTRNFVENLQRLEREGQMETLAMILGFVGVVRAAARVGRHFAESAYHRYLSNNRVQVDQEKIFAKVNWEDVRSFQVTPEPSEPSRSNSSFGRFVQTKRTLQLSPIQPTVAVQVQVQRVNQGQPLRPIDGDDDDDNNDDRQIADKYRTTIERANEHSTHTAIVVSRNAGKQALVEDPLGDPWTPEHATVKE